MKIAFIGGDIDLSFIQDIIDYNNIEYQGEIIDFSVQEWLNGRLSKKQLESIYSK